MSDEKAIRKLKREKAFWQKVSMVLMIKTGIIDREYVDNQLSEIETKIKEEKKMTKYCTGDKPATAGEARQVELASKLNTIDTKMASEPYFDSSLEVGVFNGWLVEKGILNEDEGIIHVLDPDRWYQRYEKFVYKPTDPDLQDAANVANESTDMSEIYVSHYDGSISRLSNAQLFLMLGEIDPDGSRTRLAIQKKNQQYFDYCDAGFYDGLYENDVKAYFNECLHKAGLIEPSDSIEILDDNDYEEWNTQYELLQNNTKRFTYTSKDPVMNELATELNSNDDTSSVYIQHADGSRSSMSGYQFVALVKDEFYLNERKANVDNYTKLFNEIKELGKR